MKTIEFLRRWLGSRSMARPRSKYLAAPRLGCEYLEDRITPSTLYTDKTLAYVAGDQVALPVTGTELIGQIRSTNPLQDLSNIVQYFGISSAVNLASSSVLFPLGNTSLVSIRLTSSQSATTVTQLFQSTGLFEWISPNYIYLQPSSGSGELREFAPNDPLFPQQYHHPIIQTPQAWNTTQGNPSVIVAVLDDGIDINHPDLKDSIWSNPLEIAGNSLDDDGNGFVDDVYGWDFVNNRPVVTPDRATDRHGTQVAGLIAGAIDNATGIAGVAGQASVMSLKVIGNGPTTSLTLARAVGYAVQNGAKIINNSLNIDPFVNDPVFRAGVAFAESRGLLWVNSAGNLNIANPARQTFDQMLIVAATDRNDAKTVYSNYGTGIDLTAPGGLTNDGLITTFPGSGYGPAFGTSMAAALVSGAAALIWSANPGLTRDQVSAIILGNADAIEANNPAYLDLLGAGRLNIGEALSDPNFVTRLGRLQGLPNTGDPAPPTLDSFVLRLVSNLNPNTVTPSNFELRWAGLDNQFGTGDDLLIPFTINGGQPYFYGTNQLVFQVNAALQPGLYRFTARSGGLTDPFGRPVDGNRNGQPGGDLVHHFGIANQVRGRVYEDIRRDGFEDSYDTGVSGRTVFADLNGNGIFDRVSFTYNQPTLAIPDANSSGVSASVVVAGLNGPACDISVSVMLAHPVLSDLIIKLVGPNGEEIVLFRNRQVEGSITSALKTLHFQDDIEESFEQTPTLHSYRLNPTERLDRLRGMNVNGTWRLVVVDSTPLDIGTLHGFTLSIGTEPCAITDENGYFALDGLPPGVVTPIVLMREPGWSRSDGGATIPVIPGPDAPQISFGLVRDGSIYGRVLRDTGDQQFSPGDVGQSGIRVFVDRNGNGELDDGDIVTTTDAQGNFRFDGLTPSTYSIRVHPEPGFEILSPAVRTVTLASSTATVQGAEFLLRRETGAIRVTVPPVGGDQVQTQPVNDIPIILSEPIPEFQRANIVILRDGVQVPLQTATLIGSGIQYRLIGLNSLTNFDGAYTIRVSVPAPLDQPERQPAPVEIDWSLDASPPVATLIPLETVGVTGVRIRFDEPVTGLTVNSFQLIRNGVIVPLQGADLSGTGTEFLLGNLGSLTRDAGEYTLSLLAGGASDTAGNLIPGGFATTWVVTENLPPPLRPREGQRTVVATGEGSAPLIIVHDTVTGQHLFTIVAYDVNFTGGVRVATGDVNGDGVDDIIAVPGPGGGPHVRVFDGRTGSEIQTFMAFEDSFTGGLFVATGDLNGDGKVEIIITPDLGGGPRVRVIDGATLAPLADFFGIADPDFRGGARAALGDMNGDGTLDLIISAGNGGGPRIAGYTGQGVLDGTLTTLFPDFFIFEETLRNGAYLAIGDVNGDGWADIVAGGGPGGSPRIVIMSGRNLIEDLELVPIASFFAGDTDSRGGVRLAVKDLDGDNLADLFTADGGLAPVRSYLGKDILASPDPDFTEIAFIGPVHGGVYVG